MRVQHKPLVAEAEQWMGGETQFVIPSLLMSSETRPVGIVRPEYCHVILKRVIRVEVGDFVVKYPHTRRVDVFPPDEFHQRFNHVEPGVVLPLMQEE